MIVRVFGLVTIVLGLLVATFLFNLDPIAVALPVSDAHGFAIGVAWVAIMLASVGLVIVGGRL